MCGERERGTSRCAEAPLEDSPHSVSVLVPVPRTPPPHSFQLPHSATALVPLPAEPYFAAFAVGAFATAATIRVSDRRSRRSITSAGEWL